MTSTTEPKTLEEALRELARLRAEIADLKRSERILDALYGAGVDNWEGYDFAMEGLEDDTD